MEKVKGVLKSQQGSICAEGGCRQPGARPVQAQYPLSSRGLQRLNWKCLTEHNWFYSLQCSCTMEVFVVCHGFYFPCPYLPGWEQAEPVRPGLLGHHALSAAPGGAGWTWSCVFNPFVLNNRACPDSSVCSSQCPAKWETTIDRLSTCLCSGVGILSFCILTW